MNGAMTNSSTPYQNPQSRLSVPGISLVWHLRVWLTSNRCASRQFCPIYRWCATSACILIRSTRSLFNKYLYIQRTQLVRYSVKINKKLSGIQKIWVEATTSKLTTSDLRVDHLFLLRYWIRCEVTRNQDKRDYPVRHEATVRVCTVCRSPEICFFELYATWKPTWKNFKREEANDELGIGFREARNQSGARQDREKGRNMWHLTTKCVPGTL